MTDTAAKAKKELFENMPVKKAIATMAVPTIISQLINLIYNIADTFYIGLTGDAYKTAAVTVAFTIYMMTVSFSNMFGMGGGSLMARLSGAGDSENAGRVCAFSFYGAVAIALLYSLLIGAFLDPVLYLLGASAKTIGFARQYVIYVVIAGNVPVILSMTCGHLLRNAGYSRQASIGMSGGGILNIILDPLFMFVIFPKGQEVTGAAVATLISNIVSCIYLIAVMHRYSHASHLSVRLSDAFALSRELIGRLFAVGVPSAVLTGLFDVANIFLNALMAAHGDLQLAAIGIVMKAERLPNALNVGLCQGMVPLVAYSYSRGMTARMNEIIKRVRIYGIIIGTASFVLFEALAPQVVHIFLSTSAGDVEGSTAAIAFATVFLRIRCAAPLPQFFNYSTSFTLQAVGDGKDTLIHAAVRELVFYIPFMFILNRLFGTYGLVSAVVIGEACGAAFAFLLLHLWKRKNIPTVSGDISVHK